MTPAAGALRKAAWTRTRRGVQGVAAFLLLAELASRTGLVDRDVLPPLSSVLTEAGRLAGDAAFRTDLRATVTAWLLGLAEAVALAVPLGLVLGSLPRLDAVVRPVLEFLRPIPAVAIIPLAMLLFPDALDLKTTIVVYASCWPVLINTVYGLREVDPVARESLASFGFGPLSVLLRVSLPSTAPFIAAGVRMSAGIALIATVSAELFASGSAGIGTFINTAGSSARMEPMLAAALWAGVLGLLGNGVLAALEHRLFRWRTAR
ncbi:ABC transporter permease [Actinomadura oligospora]|uniref:ABC transporter permease n=1 Tax=Actinomadura oligospora TaxID=111804 RepID=UPI0004ACCAB5|nr:ABC transporter permease [Actinomadura oligospora]